MIANLLPGWLSEQAKDIPDCEVAAERVRKRKGCLDLVPIPATIPLLADVARRREISDDRVGTSLGDVEATRDVTKPNPGIVRNAEQRKSVIREEVPPGHAIPYHNYQKLITSSATLAFPTV